LVQLAECAPQQQRSIAGLIDVLQGGHQQPFGLARTCGPAEEGLEPRTTQEGQLLGGR